MRSLKIGVLTFHRCINYGSYWQTRCLVEGILDQGHQAVILDHQSKRINYSEWKCALQPVLPTSVPKSDYALYRKKIKKFFQAFELLPLSEPFGLEDPGSMDEYDLIVIGSDEVWNLSHPWYGGCPLFFGEGIRSPRLVAYAASFGNYDSQMGLDEQWVSKLRKFGMISIRDENSQILIKEYLGFKPRMVLDPCLQFPIRWERKSLENLPESYLGVYGHNFSDYFIERVREYARLRNLPLVSIGYRNDWADEQWISAGPDDFVNFIDQSTGVVTNFFHGCVFSLKMSKPFVCEKSAYRSNKLNGLLQSLAAEHHLMGPNSGSDEYEFCLGQAFRPEILQNIESLRKCSDDFLKTALGETKMQEYESPAKSK